MRTIEARAQCSLGRSCSWRVFSVVPSLAPCRQNCALLWLTVVSTPHGPPPRLSCLSLPPRFPCLSRRDMIHQRTNKRLLVCTVRRQSPAPSSLPPFGTRPTGGPIGSTESYTETLAPSSDSRGPPLEGDGSENDDPATPPPAPGTVGPPSSQAPPSSAPRTAAPTGDERVRWRCCFFCCSYLGFLLSQRAERLSYRPPLAQSLGLR